MSASSPRKEPAPGSASQDGMTGWTRQGCLLAVLVAVAWSGSVFAPWAAGPHPRPWLQDALYYTRFALTAWLVAETLYRFRQRRRHRAVAAEVTLAMAWVVVAAGWLASTGTGMDLRTTLSAQPLAEAARMAPGDTRQRVGFLLVDTARRPCTGQAWLWLGRPFGAGTGTNLAVVDAGDSRPLTPMADAFVFRHVDGRWWIAYQHPGRYQQGLAGASARGSVACMPGTLVSRHRDGVDFIVGRRPSPSIQARDTATR